MINSSSLTSGKETDEMVRRVDKQQQRHRSSENVTLVKTISIC
jgi:hypothetical protein